jgi:flavoprotein hydroxylase
MRSPLRSADETHRNEADVLIVGYGPVGQTLANLLARKGRLVTVIERWPEPYPMPRAVSFDGESARILAAAGVGDHLSAFGEPSRDYIWKNAQGQSILRIDVAENGLCGWPDSTSMYQPGLEEALTIRGAGLPNLQVHRGYEAVELTDCGERVSVVAEGREGESLEISARWVVGCDGANSFVRSRTVTTVTDFGFSSDWLTCDVILHEPREFVPNNLQLCDPARPTTAVSAGPGHRRWEFMRVLGETVQELDRAETAWRLLAPFDVTPQNATLERHGVYSFKALCMDQWRAGNILLAGDAVHLMPPFAGQGMCSGFRDAANLAWKLDLVLAGTAAQDLLDTYTTERSLHVRHAIGMSVDLGKVICQSDPAAAADRDAAMLATQELAPEMSRPKSVLYPLAEGLLYRGGRMRPKLPAGSLAPQGRVARGSVAGLLDEVVGRGFVLMTLADPHDLLAAEQCAFLHSIGTHLVHLVPAGTDPGQLGDLGVIDIDEVYVPYLDRHKAFGVLVRPDFYLFGAARDRDGVPPLIEDLRRQLSAG